jgi:hypothetical protein
VVFSGYPHDIAAILLKVAFDTIALLRERPFNLKGVGGIWFFSKKIF